MNETDSHVYIEVIKDYPEYHDVTEPRLSDINREDPPYDTIQVSDSITSDGIEPNDNASRERGPNHVTSHRIETNDYTSPEGVSNHVTSHAIETNDTINPERGPTNIKSRRKNCKKYMIYAVIFVLLVCIGAVGLYFGLSQKSKDNTALDEVTSLTTTTTTGTAQADGLTEDVTHAATTTTDKTPGDDANESTLNSSITTTVAFTENETPVYTEEYLEEKIQNLATRFAQYSDKIEDLESRLKKVEEGKKVRYQAPFIAVEPKESNYSSLQRLLFNHTEVNPEGYYDLTTGLYRCPVNGIYFFRLMLSTKHYASGIIGQGGTRIEINFSTPEGVSLATFTGSIIHYCKAGAVVLSATRHQSFLADSSQTNTFSGFLIEEL